MMTMVMMMAILAMMTMVVLMVRIDLLGSLSFLELKRKLARLLQTHVRAQFHLRVNSISELYLRQI